MSTAPASTSTPRWRRKPFVVGTAVLAAVAATAVGLRTAGAGEAEDDRAAPQTKSTHASVDGLWRTDGYGTIVSIKGDVAQEYQVTTVSCLKGDTARRTDALGAGTTFAKESGETFTVRTGPEEGRARLTIAGSPGHRELRHLDDLPDRCADKTPTDPQAVFDVFWQTFAENYPFFEAKNVDWKSLRDRYRPTIDKNTTDDELFTLFQRMLDPLDDAHVQLMGEVDGEERFFAEPREGTVPPNPELDEKTRKLVEESDLDGRELTLYAQGRIGYADLPDNLGYLRIAGFTGYSDKDGATYADEREVLDATLDKILTAERTKRLTGLIVDLRVNGGGYDSLGLRIAERLTDRTHFAYSKQARNHPTDADRFTRPQPQHVRPARDVPRYTGPITVLTGGSTMSAGETFTQALLDRPGRTVRIGEPTQGVFSDILERRLPNGWQVGLPNEEFRTRSGRTFDGTGIPPQLKEPVFRDEHFTQKTDPAFDRAVAELRRSRD